MTDHQSGVLVVEDEALLLFTIADALREDGFQVYEAVNADRAIKELVAHPDIGMLFTDINMPGSMDGLRLSATVKDRWPHVKIIVTSGKHRPAPELMPDGGVFMAKPYTSDKVVNAMRQLMA